jgi:hypothetical protein
MDSKYDRPQIGNIRQCWVRDENGGWNSAISRFMGQYLRKNMVQNAVLISSLDYVICVFVYCMNYYDYCSPLAGSAG